MRFPPQIERWRGVVARHFPASEVDRMLWVIQRETAGTGDPTIQSGHVVNGRREPSFGLFQINQDAHAKAISLADSQDPEKAAAYAARLWKDQGYRPWSVTHGGFPEELGGATAAAGSVARRVPDPNAMGPAGRTFAQATGQEYKSDAERAWYLSLARGEPVPTSASTPAATAPRGGGGMTSEFTFGGDETPGAPPVRFTAAGEAFEWDGAKWVRSPQWDRAPTTEPGTGQATLTEQDIVAAGGRKVAPGIYEVKTADGRTVRYEATSTRGNVVLYNPVVTGETKKTVVPPAALAKALGRPGGGRAGEGTAPLEGDVTLGRERPSFVSGTGPMLLTSEDILAAGAEEGFQVGEPIGYAPELFTNRETLPITLGGIYEGGGLTLQPGLAENPSSFLSSPSFVGEVPYTDEQGRPQRRGVGFAFDPAGQLRASGYQPYGDERDIGAAMGTMQARQTAFETPGLSFTGPGGPNSYIEYEMQPGGGGTQTYIRKGGKRYKAGRPGEALEYLGDETDIESFQTGGRVFVGGADAGRTGALPVSSWTAPYEERPWFQEHEPGLYWDPITKYSVMGWQQPRRRRRPLDNRDLEPTFMGPDWSHFGRSFGGGGAFVQRNPLLLVDAYTGQTVATAAEPDPRTGASRPEVIDISPTYPRAPMLQPALRQQATMQARMPQSFTQGLSTAQRGRNAWRQRRGIQDLLSPAGRQAYMSLVG
jgi:hypothetical protein